MNDNGLITKVWGSHSWITNHAITFGYPINPTEEEKKNYRNYFISLGNVLPCKYCRESYNIFIKTGDTKLRYEDLSSRETLSKWFYRLHNAVNKKLDVEYNVSYEDVVEKYESLRANCDDKNSKGCTTPLHIKADSYIKLKQKDCPIIKLKYVEPFIKIGKQRGFNDNMFNFYNIIKKTKNLNELKKSDIWKERNKLCQTIIDHMRENAIPSIELSGTWSGWPTNEELILLLNMCTNLEKKDLIILIDNLPNNKMYEKL